MVIYTTMTSLVKQPSLFPVFLVIFVRTLGFSIVLPFLVFVVMKFGGDAIVYGLLAATYPAFQLIGSPILGKWSDVYGRKKVLLLSNVGTSVGWILFLFALFLPTEKSFSIHIAFLGTFVVVVPLFILFLARAIDGITGGNISIANAYLADVSSDSTRSKNFGKMAISSYNMLVWTYARLRLRIPDWARALTIQFINSFYISKLHD